ncbi:hypothetical protein GW915_06930 [bacterium]|nr:hypothetical protein [bacterium]
MKTFIVTPGQGILPADVYDKIRDDCLFALNSITANSKEKFIVNPSIWHNLVKNKKGQLNAQPRVINSADYLTKRIGKSLTELGWMAGAKEKTINNQRIDGYLEIDYQGPMFKIPRESFVSFIAFLEKEIPSAIKNGDIRKAFNFYYNFYYASSWVDPKYLGIESCNYFKPTNSRPIRIGLEFETGNIASSFRALHKLEGLFAEGLIDFGVFITSIDRANTSGKIWPLSNRNGSFEELKNRKYSENYLLPRLDIGFSPDAYSEKAKYLSHDGSLFDLEKTNSTVKIQETTFQKFVFNSIEYWKPT